MIAAMPCEDRVSLKHVSLRELTFSLVFFLQ